MTTDPTRPPAATADVIESVEHLAATLQAVAGDDYWPAAAAQCTDLLTHAFDDGTIDTMRLGLTSAHAYREDPTGREVKKFTGTAHDVDKAMRALLPPGQPDAPDGSDHIPGPSGMGT